MVRVIDWITILSEFIIPPTNDAWGKEIILWGETDGINGIDNVVRLLNARPESTLIVTGGDYGREEKLDNIGSLDLFNDLSRRLISNGWSPREVNERVIIESMSRHTGDQRRIVGALLTAIAPQNIFVVLPKYHMPRFLMTVGLPLYQKNFRPNIYPWPFGEWGTHHKAKGPKDQSAETFTYAELLALPPTPSRYEGKLDCGEVDKIIQYANPKEDQCLTFRQAREWLRI